MDELDLYTWLYEHYAAALFADRLGLDRRNRRRLMDMASDMRLHWGAEVFALGVRFGRDLAEPHVPDRDCGRLLYFLPQLDQPVP